MDILDESSIRAAATRVGDLDCFIHVAGAIRPPSFHAVNAQGTEWLVRHFGKNVKHWIQLSSAAVFEPRGVVTEDSPQCPESAYGRSKFQADEAVRRGTASWTLFHPTAILGAHMPGNFLRRLAAILHRGIDPTPPGPPTFLNTVYVGDVVGAVCRAATSKQEPNQNRAFLLSEDLPFAHAATAIRECLDLPAPRFCPPRWFWKLLAIANPSGFAKSLLNTTRYSSARYKTHDPLWPQSGCLHGIHEFFETQGDELLHAKKAEEKLAIP